MEKERRGGGYVVVFPSRFYLPHKLTVKLKIGLLWVRTFPIRQMGAREKMHDEGTVGL